MPKPNSPVGLHGHCAHQPGHAVAVVEMLIYHMSGTKPSPMAISTRDRLGELAAAAPGNHMVAHDRGPGAGTGQGHFPPPLSPLAQQVNQRGIGQ